MGTKWWQNWKERDSDFPSGLLVFQSDQTSGNVGWNQFNTQRPNFPLMSVNSSSTVDVTMTHFCATKFKVFCSDVVILFLNLGLQFKSNLSQASKSWMFLISLSVSFPLFGWVPFKCTVFFFFFSSQKEIEMFDRWNLKNLFYADISPIFHSFTSSHLLPPTQIHRTNPPLLNIFHQKKGSWRVADGKIIDIYHFYFASD